MDIRKVSVRRPSVIPGRRTESTAETSDVKTEV